MGHNTIMHELSIAEDAGHAVSLTIRGGRFFGSCWIERIGDRTITVIQETKNKKTKRTSIKIVDVIGIDRAEESDAA